MKRIYLATPYSGQGKFAKLNEHNRFVKACEIAGQLIQDGHCVFSPICHSHPISVLCEMDGAHDYWQAQNDLWLDWADEIWVVKMSGWEDSKGVQWEIGWADKHEKPVRYIPDAG